MATLEIARKVAVHPHMLKLAERRRNLWTRFVLDYGKNFYVPNYFGTKPQEEFIGISEGVRGVNRWTIAEEREYKALEFRIQKCRKIFEDFYSAE